MNINIKLKEGAKLPIAANNTDAGFDLTVTRVENSWFKSTVYFGIVTNLPKNHWVDLRPRSSIYKKRLILSNSCGVIDEGFTGEWRAVFYKLPFFSTPYKIGERAVQAILRKCIPTKFIVVNELKETDRGTGGFGSSGI